MYMYYTPNEELDSQSAAVDWQAARTRSSILQLKYRNPRNSTALHPGTPVSHHLITCFNLIQLMKDKYKTEYDGSDVLHPLYMGTGGLWEPVPGTGWFSAGDLGDGLPTMVPHMPVTGRSGDTCIHNLWGSCAFWDRFTQNKALQSVYLQ